MNKELLLGQISAAIISIVTASFVIIASLLGFPTPYVQFTTFSVLAISSIKDGFYLNLEKVHCSKDIFGLDCSANFGILVELFRTSLLLK